MTKEIDTYTIGRFISRMFIDFLKQCIFEGMDISYQENKGFFQSEFLVKGTREDLNKILKVMQDYKERIS